MPQNGMTDVREQGLQVFRELLPGADINIRDGRFGDELLEDQPSTLKWFPQAQAYLREHQPPALIVWGPHDGYMPEKSARAYHRDLPDAPLHLLGGGHWLLETHLGEVVPLVHEFLAGVYAR
jgi:pimeloyl-ACP methyl ester carboxylesterase